MRFANAACGLFIYLFTILMSATVNKCTDRGSRGRDRSSTRSRNRGSDSDGNCSGK